MDEWLGLLAAGVLRYLDGLCAEDDADEPMKDERRLAAAWRTLLALHAGGGSDDGGGECRRCRGGHAGACTVWQVAIGYFARRAPPT